MIADRVMGLALVGMSLLLPVAAFDVGMAAIVAVVFIGPFLAFAFAFILAFGAGLALTGDPDRFLDWVFRGERR